ncbi:MAG: hypothetical protein A2X58_01400 [Nitrospirae bacterium GWC2_56_14]|nr:MAG: hypothetical protein A2X58_01400 [Nitrospirae bacterium GWC2_56_14]
MNLTSFYLPAVIARMLTKPLLAALFVVISAAAAFALPPAVELDRLMAHAEAALKAGSYGEAADNLSQAKKLGIELPENFALGYATALDGLGKAHEAKGELGGYFNKYGTKGPSYKAVLELLVQIEAREKGKPAGTALTLPPAVELDRLMLHGKTALKANAFSDATIHLARVKKLHPALPEDFALSYARALVGLGRANEAKGELDAYFNKYGTKGPSYKEVLELLVQIEAQEKGKKSKTVNQSASAAGVSTDRKGVDQDRSKAIRTDLVHQPLPARPQLPFTVSEDVWRALEASDAYRAAPRAREYKKSYQAKIQREYTGAKSKPLKKPAAAVKKEKIEATSLGDKCGVVKTSITDSGKESVFEDYICGGFLSLGHTVDGKTGGILKSLDELKGSLFPMRAGNKMSLSFQSASPADTRFDSVQARSCEVISQGPASELHPAFKGTAWKIQCKGSYTSNYDHTTRLSPEIDDYYLEDLGLNLSAIGQFNYDEKTFFIPKPFDQTVLTAEGDYGSRTTTMYTSYDWSVDPKE